MTQSYDVNPVNPFAAVADFAPIETNNSAPNTLANSPFQPASSRSHSHELAATPRGATTPQTTRPASGLPPTPSVLEGLSEAASHPKHGAAQVAPAKATAAKPTEMPGLHAKEELDASTTATDASNAAATAAEPKKGANKRVSQASPEEAKATAKKLKTCEHNAKACVTQLAHLSATATELANNINNLGPWQYLAQTPQYQVFVQERARMEEVKAKHPLMTTLLVSNSDFGHGVQPSDSKLIWDNYSLIELSFKNIFLGGKCKFSIRPTVRYFGLSHAPLFLKAST